jgi:glycine hydroxymethyltransferase
LAPEKWGKALNSHIFPGIQGGPLMHVIAAKAVGFKEAMGEPFKADQIQVVENAKALAAELIAKDFRLVSGGTDNHLFLLDLTNKDITGKEAEELLELGGLTVNKNAIPFDTKPRFVTSGVRIGTPTVTTRGLKVAEMLLIADWIERVITKRDQQTIAQVRQEVRDLCARFPLSNIVDPV